MNLTLPPLALVDGDLTQYTDDLPQVLPRYFIPRLQEKPQDPIMDALRIEQESRASRPEPSPGLVDMVEVTVQECSPGSPKEECTLFWEHVVKREVRVQVSYPVDGREVVPNNAVRIKSGHGIHCGPHSLGLLHPVPFYLNSQVALSRRLATSM
jgi:hypothetical protein